MPTSKHSTARGARRGASLAYVATATSWHAGPVSPSIDRCVVAMWDIVGASAIVGACYPASEYPYRDAEWYLSAAQAAEDAAPCPECGRAPDAGHAATCDYTDAP